VHPAWCRMIGRAIAITASRCMLRLGTGRATAAGTGRPGFSCEAPGCSKEPAKASCSLEKGHSSQIGGNEDVREEVRE
jgi:hypothetical protein